MKSLKYLVVGTGRSGTVFMSRFLTSLGIVCGHESIFTHYGLEEAIKRLQNPDRIQNSAVSEDGDRLNIDSSLQVAESSYMAAPFLNHNFLKDTKIIHVVRNPIKTISSLYFDAQFFNEEELPQIPYYNFVLRYIPEINQFEDRLTKNILFWSLWNQMIEQRSKKTNYFRFKIDEGVYSDLYDFLGVKPTDYVYKNVKANTWKKRVRNITHDDITNIEAAEILWDFAKRYGYNLPKFFN